MRVLVILPTLNEAESIGEVVSRARAALPDATVLVVDDGSTDGTSEMVEKAGIELGQVHLLQRDTKRGLGDAYRTGFAWGMDRGFDALVEMDADLSHDPDALPDLVSALASHDLVIGSRYIAGGSIPDWGLGRRLLSRGANIYSSFMLGVPVRDMTAGFRAYRAPLLRRLHLETVRADGYCFQVEMTYRAACAGARIEEVPIRFMDRTTGQSKMSSEIVLEALLLVTRWGLRRQQQALVAELRALLRRGGR